MNTTDSDLLFKTDAQLDKEGARQAKLKRTKTVGEPIHLPSKPLALEVRGDEAWTAESGFVLRASNLQTGKTLRVFKGHSGPVTSLALWDLPASNGASARRLVFSGSWDKSIRLWDRDTGALLSTTIAHSDFLKSLLVLPHLPTPLLVSGSSDKTLNVYSLLPVVQALSSSSGTEAAEIAPLKTTKQLKTHTRPVDKLAAAIQVEPDSIRFYSADSLGRTLVWEVVCKPNGGEVKVEEVARLAEHATKVTDLHVGEEGIWTASADTHAHYHPQPPPVAASTACKPLVLAHAVLANPPIIHSVLPLTHIQPPLLLTGSADDYLRVWDTSVGEGPQARLVREVEGHCAEVIAIRRWIRTVEEDGGKREEWVVSAGLDGTLRRWRLADLLTAPKMVEMKPEEPKEKGGILASGMTAEEEAELAELMSDED